MDVLLYRVIKSKKQYREYCKKLKTLVSEKSKTTQQKDEIELLMLLIEKWDENHNTFQDADPVQVLKYLMDVNNLKSVDMAAVLGVSKSLFSDIINYRRGLSKEVIRKLAERFKVSQSLFNRPYELALIKE